MISIDRTMDTMVQQIGIPKYRVTDCLNALIRSKDAIKYNPKVSLELQGSVS